jgi:hypothetical protein
MELDLGGGPVTVSLLGRLHDFGEQDALIDAAAVKRRCGKWQFSSDGTTFPDSQKTGNRHSLARKFTSQLRARYRNPAIVYRAWNVVRVPSNHSSLALGNSASACICRDDSRCWGSGVNGFLLNHDRKVDTIKPNANPTTAWKGPDGYQGTASAARTGPSDVLEIQ